MEELREWGRQLKLDYQWSIYSESDKSSGEYLSTFEGVMEGRPDELLNIIFVTGWAMNLV
jgi:hypothetical protein